MKLDLELIEDAKNEVLNSEAWIEFCKEQDVDKNLLFIIPVCFSDKIEVSARTDHGIIYLNSKLKKDIDKLPEYILHESCHFIQQTFSNGPTKGSVDSDDYLENPSEKEGFQYQIKFISDTKGIDKAEDYVEQVLDHHEQDGIKREKRKKDLLMLASQLELGLDLGKRDKFKLSPEQIERNKNNSEKLLKIIEKEENSNYIPKKKQLKQLLLLLK